MLLLKRLNRECHGEISSVNYTTKEQGWLKSKKASFLNRCGQSVAMTNSMRDFVMTGFLSGLTNRYSCYNCRFACAERKADLTLADFWGLQEFPEQHFLGVSLVVVHSPRVGALLSEADLEVHRTGWKKFIRHNPRMICGRQIFYQIHPARRWMPKILKHASFHLLPKIYGGSISARELPFLPYKVMRYLIYRFASYYISRQVRRFEEGVLE